MERLIASMVLATPLTVTVTTFADPAPQTVVYGDTAYNSMLLAAAIAVPTTNCTVPDDSFSTPFVDNPAGTISYLEYEMVVCNDNGSMGVFYGYILNNAIYRESVQDFFFDLERKISLENCPAEPQCLGAKYYHVKLWGPNSCLMNGWVKKNPTLVRQTVPIPTGSLMLYDPGFDDDLPFEAPIGAVMCQSYMIICADEEFPCPIVPD